MNATAQQLDRQLTALELTREDAEGLFAVSDALAEQYRLRVILSDPAVDDQLRGQIAARLFADRIPSGAMQAVVILAEAIEKSRELEQATERAAVRAVLRHSESLDQVQDELFKTARLIESDGELQNTLRDSQIDIEQRQQLLADLLSDKAAEATVRLASRSVLARSGSIIKSLTSYVDIAAELKNHKIAVVTVAKPLSAQQQASLKSELDRIYGIGVDIHEQIDPDVLGGVRIEIADDQIDGTIRNRIEQVRQQIG